MKQSKFTISLVGNPNAGKSTLFNALTGSHQKIGNWPGVTVDRKSGYFESNDLHIEIVDLPGVYSLLASEEGAIDEHITTKYIISNTPDLIVNVLDASNLERNLYLTTQLLELDVPLILAVNMIDIAKKRGITIDIEKLLDNLGCPVLPIISSKNEGINELKQTIIDSCVKPDLLQRKKLLLPYPKEIVDAINIISSKSTHKHKYFLAIQSLEVGYTLQEIDQKLDEDADILIADTRYTLSHKLVDQVVKESIHVKTTVTSAVDRIVLNRILGIPIFLAVMYLMFFFSIDVGGYFQNFFQSISNLIFVHGLHNILASWHLPSWLIFILTAGIGKGINTTATFIPVLTAMFIFLALLETSGYMARAGFVIDRLMTAIGLPGKSFVPLLIGFGCNVPAIMAARTLENKRDRILTVLITPFMSCGARFAVYAIFITAFFPKGGQNIVFALYLIGILIAMFTGLILRKTILKGQQSTLITELPPYHIPTIRNISLQTWLRLKSFITKAGRIIIPVCLLLSVLNTVYIGKHSILANAGHAITPIFRPMGIRQDNWPATVGLMTGVVAKEVVIGTLNTLYDQQDKNVKKSQDIYGQMYKRFMGKPGAFAYLLFVLLYFPCIPAMATMFRELGWRWSTFSMLWNTGAAYCIATIFYQSATFNNNPFYATISISSIFFVFLLTILVMRKLSKKEN